MSYRHAACERCKKTADSRRTVFCIGCQKERKVCPSCLATFVGCSPDCEKSHRERMGRIWEEPLPFELRRPKDIQE